MAKVISADQLADAVKDIMDEYGDQVREGAREAVEYTAKQGVKELKSNSSATFGGKGGYASSWNYEMYVSPFGESATIYSNKPGLPHLLEHGHAKVVGGRTYPDPVKGRTHIAPVQEKMNQVLEKKIKMGVS